MGKKQFSFCFIEASARYPRGVTPPGGAKDEGVRLSRKQRRVLKEKRLSFGSVEAFPEYSDEGGPK
jgi:hypothetical protein